MISCDTWICRYMIQRSNHVPPELKWHHMMFFFYIYISVGKPKGSNIPMMNDFSTLIWFMFALFLGFYQIGKPMQISTWSLTERSCGVPRSICWYANPSCRDLKFPWAGSFGSDHQTMGIQRMRHTHATHAYAMVYIYTHIYVVNYGICSTISVFWASFFPSPSHWKKLRNYFGVMHFIVFHSYLQYPCRGGTAGANERESIDWTCL